MEPVPGELERVRTAVRATRRLLAKPDVAALWQSREQLETAVAGLSGLECRLRAGERGMVAAEFELLAGEVRVVGALLRQVGRQFEGWDPAPVTRDIFVA